MAEVFGAVVSDIGLLQLSAELLDGAIRLKDFYDRTRNAPSLLSDLSFELETISLFLQDLEQRRLDDRYDTVLMQRCIIRCGEKTNSIRAQIDILDERIQKCSKFGKASVAFKQKELLAMLQDLERWKSSIVVAFVSSQAKHNSEHASVIKAIDQTLIVQSAQLQSIQATGNAHWELATRVQSIEVVSRPSLRDARDLSPSIASNTITELSPQGFVESEEDEEEPQNISKNRRRTEKQRREAHKQTTYFRARISLPSWLTRCVWEVAAHRSGGCWTLAMNTYNIVPYDAPIFEFCKAGDLESVRDLIARGEASALDRDDYYGVTTVHFAGASGHVQLCRFLLETGGSVVLPDLGNIARKLAHEHEPILSNVTTAFTPLLRLFVEEFDLDVDIENDFFESRGLSYMYPLFVLADLDCLEILQRNQTVPYPSRSSQTRFELALNLQPRSRDKPGLMLRRAGLRSVTTEFAPFRVRAGESALHVACDNLGSCIEGENLNVDPGLNSRDHTMRLEWTAFVVELLKHNANIVLTNDKQQTPLMKLLLAQASCAEMHSWPDLPKVLIGCVQIWATIVVQSGKDLSTYAAEECEIWTRYHKGGLRWIDSCIAMVPLFGSDPSSCSIVLRPRAQLPVYTLRRPPGAWPLDEFKPSTILWEPNSDEQSEGVWRCQKWRFIESGIVIDALFFPEDYDRLRVIQLFRAEDDSGPITMNVNRRKRPFRRSRRSVSQPPPIYRRLAAYKGVDHLVARPWLPPFHLCPYDMSFRFDCPFERSSGKWRVAASFRHCIRGHSISADSLQETEGWKSYSFAGLFGELD